MSMGVGVSVGAGVADDGLVADAAGNGVGSARLGTGMLAGVGVATLVGVIVGTRVGLPPEQAARSSVHNTSPGNRR